MQDEEPQVFKWPTNGKHPNGTTAAWQYGCYFPATDLCVTDMGRRSTGKPEMPGLIWETKDR